MKNKWLFDLFPVIVFFAAFKLADIYVATALAIVVNILQIGWALLRKHPVSTMQWMGLGIIVVFGGMTLALQDETFIKWKPSILYWSFAVGLLIAMLMGKSPIQAVMGEQISLPAPIWKRLNLIWTAFFALMGVLNLVVAWRFSTDTWVSFKLFGTIGLTLAFIIVQGFYLGPHLQEQEDRHETKP